MRSKLSFSIVLLSRWGIDLLPRLFQSLAWQSGDLQSLEVVFVDTGEDADVSRKARLWANILPSTFSFLHIPAATRTHEAGNLGIAAATGDLVVHPHPTTRLHPYFLDDVSLQFEAKSNLDVLYTDFVDLGKGAAGLVQLPRFTRWRLKARNVVGPLAVYRREALASLPGLRPDTLFQAWDLGVQAALGGLYFARLDNSLYTCTLDRPDEDQARQGAAMVVVNNPGFFREEVIRWALAATRRAPWALRSDPFRIPVARTVRQLFKEQVQDTNQQKPGWLWHLTDQQQVAPTPIPIYHTDQ